MSYSGKNENGEFICLKDNSDRKDRSEDDESEDYEDGTIKTNSYWISNRNGPPIDHGWAWMTVFGSFGVLALTVGSLKSFGVLLVDLSRRLDAPTSVITSTQSLAGFFYLGLAPLGNAISDRYSHRVVVFVGGIITGVGLIATAYVPSIQWLYITYGIITGIGFGLTMNPALVCMGLHFNTRRSFANGLSAAGAGAGSFLLPNLMRYLLHEYGFQGCLLITGAIVLNTCCFACLFRPRSFWQRKTNQLYIGTDEAIEIPVNWNQTIQLEVVKEQMKTKYMQNSSTSRLDQKQTEECNFGNTSFSSHPNIDFCSERKSALKFASFKSLNMEEKDYTKGRKYENDADSSLLYPSIEYLSSFSNLKAQGNSSSFNIEKEEKSKCRIGCKNALDWSLLKNPLFMLYNTSLWTGIFGHHTIYICLPSLADEFGISDTNGAFIISLVGISDLFGRISSGWFSDLKFLERKIVFIIALGLFTSCCFIIPQVNSFVGLCVIGVFAGITTGGYSGIQLAVLADAFGVEKLSSSWGFVSFFSSISLLISPFLSGLTRDVSGTWTNVLRLSGSVMAFGFLLMVLQTFVSKFILRPKVDE